jgi:hypothetical protein
MYYYEYGDSYQELHMSSDPFDPRALRLSDEELKKLLEREPKKPPRPRPGGKFLKGPVPWNWLARALRLPGKALAVGVLLWWEAGCANRATVRFHQGLRRELGLGCHEDTVRRGLRALEAAGLVRVGRPSGRCLEVTLLDAPPDAPPPP